MTPIPKPASGHTIRDKQIDQDVDSGRALEVIAHRANVRGSISCRRFYTLGGRRAISAIMHSCVICRRVSGKARPQLLGQLPPVHTSPGFIFERVGVDYAGPVLIKSGQVHQPTVTKAYVAVFVSLAVKAVHLELVTDLSTAAFVATLRRFVARRGKPSLIMSDHGTNFIGAAHELKEMYAFLKRSNTQNSICDHCSSQNIQWRLIPENAPHFGGLWEAAVKSLKYHLRRIVGDVRLTYMYEELSTLLTQVESCLNSRPLGPLPEPEDGYEALTPGHFLIGRPVEALPDPWMLATQ